MSYCGDGLDGIRNEIFDQLAWVIEEACGDVVIGENGPDPLTLRKFIGGIEKLIDAKIEAALREKA